MCEHRGRLLAVDGALDFVGTPTVLTSDPTQTGRVITSTTADDQVCASRSVGAACLHLESDDADHRGPDRDNRDRTPASGRPESRTTPRLASGIGI